MNDDTLHVGIGWTPVAEFPSAAGDDCGVGRRATATRSKPRLRGVFHEYAFYLSIVPGVWLVSRAAAGEATIGAAAFVLSLSLLFLVSALYHRVTWRQPARFWLGRLDLAMIYVLIAGSYTPILMIHDDTSVSTWLRILWGGTLFGIVTKVLWANAPKWGCYALYVLYAGICTLPVADVLFTFHNHGGALLVAAGMLYLAGGAVYAAQRPDPVPSVFGYHEVFHVMVVIAAVIQFAAMALYVVPALEALG